MPAHTQTRHRRCAWLRPYSRTGEARKQALARGLPSSEEKAGRKNWSAAACLRFFVAADWKRRAPARSRCNGCGGRPASAAIASQEPRIRRTLVSASELITASLKREERANLFSCIMRKPTAAIVIKTLKKWGAEKVQKNSGLAKCRRKV